MGRKRWAGKVLRKVCSFLNLTWNERKEILAKQFLVVRHSWYESLKVLPIPEDKVHWWTWIKFRVPMLPCVDMQRWRAVWLARTESFGLVFQVITAKLRWRRRTSLLKSRLRIWLRFGRRPRVSSSFTMKDFCAQASVVLDTVVTMFSVHCEPKFVWAGFWPFRAFWGLWRYSVLNIAGWRKWTWNMLTAFRHTLYAIIAYMQSVVNWMYCVLQKLLYRTMTVSTDEINKKVGIK